MSVDAPLKNKVAVVTGAAQGIGRATALAFAEAGAAVVLSDLDTQQAAGQAVAAEITAAGGQAIFAVCDVRKESEIAALVALAVERYGRLDLACNNAGYQSPAVATAEVANEDWDRVMAINLKGVWCCMKHELQQMSKQETGGSIVNIASLAGLVGLENSAAYVASKHGVVGLTKTAALEYARAGIRVNAVCPGLVITKMVRDFVGDDVAIHQQLGETTPIGRPGRPEEIASAVLWLSSPGAAFTTGLAMSVDGGWVAR